MGAINYGSNKDFGLTIGYDIRRLNYEPSKEELEANDCESLEDWKNQEYWIIEDYYDQAKYALEKAHFHYFNVSLKGGYYEGFWVEVVFNYLYLDNYKEKLEAVKEATRLKKFLLECINDYGCLAVEDWWIATWHDYKATIDMLNKAIREQKQAIMKLYTDKTLTPQKWRELVGIEG